MIYLIKQEGKTKNYLKIGYTNCLDDRIKAYNTHNAEFEIIDSFEGEKDIETFAHQILNELKYKGEWYLESNEIYLVWEMCKQESKLRKNTQDIEKLKSQINLLKEQIIELQKQ